jgi:hypothetical protein
VRTVLFDTVSRGYPANQQTAAIKANSARHDRNPLRLATKEHTRMLDKQRWVLEGGIVGCVWVNDQLGIGQILLQGEGVDGVEDDVGLTKDD